MTRPDLTSGKFKVAVNRGISAVTIADAVKQPYITEDGVLNLTAIWLVHRTSRLASRIKKRPADDWSALFSLYGDSHDVLQGRESHPHGGVLSKKEDG